MANPKLERAKVLIDKTFEDNALKVYKPRDLSKIFKQNREFWNLASDTTLRKFVSFMLKSNKLKQAVLKFPHRKETRYFWGEYSVYQLAMSLNPKGYFTHYVAMSLHGLTDQIPKTIYLNSEQRPKYFIPSELEQDRIDLAFKRKPRISKNIARYKAFRICLLNGMNTGRMGVIESKGPFGEPICVTNIERTLIDSAVRPFYSGGIFEVLSAYRRAKDKVNLKALAKMLQKLDYKYPYHQAIGFYLEKAEVYKKQDIKIFEAFDVKYNFYITRQIKHSEYSQRWKLYFPKGL